jgi:hypothetical protein
MELAKYTRDNVILSVDVTSFVDFIGKYMQWYMDHPPKHPASPKS